MKTYGLLGRNIGYSLSPAMHNAALKRLKIDAEYRLFDITENGLDDFFSSLRDGRVSGCNVTVPYKEKALSYVDETDSLVKSIGALNTIAQRDGKMVGYNTDCEGFSKALTGSAEGDLGFEPAGKNIFLFGAGGAAKAVIFALLALGVKKIIIADIDRKKAEKLASTVVERQRGNATISLAEDEMQFNEFVSKSDLLVNATPCGMKNGDVRLFDYRYLHEKLYVFDLIYAKETQLLEEAVSRCARTAGGLNMLLYQAAAAFECWTGRKTPIDAMRDAAFRRFAE